jgi:HTH-type transcriptional regulator / antitoxin HipB
MLIRTPVDLGAVIRDYRRRRGLDQQAFAKKIDVSRQWVVEVEKGKARAEVGLILRALDALGIALSIAGTDALSDRKDVSGVDIDQIVERARRSDR